jgi:hypothetical protein
MSRILPLILFGIAFGFVEAAVVVYLRAIYEPLRATVLPSAGAGELFPLLTLEQLRQLGPRATRLLQVEVVRELATLVMLGSVALAISRKAGEWLAALLVAFGIWDIFFYVFLKLTISWPASWMTWDLLFLIPVPWSAPVLAPLVVSLTMVTAGWIYLARPFPIRVWHWAAIFGGGLIMVTAFCWDWRNLMAGRLPNPFPWWLLVAGDLIAVASFVHARNRALH